MKAEEDGNPQEKCYGAANHQYNKTQHRRLLLPGTETDIGGSPQSGMRI